MQENELRLELKGLRDDINLLVSEVRDLRTSVHGNKPLNIDGLNERLKKLEADEKRLTKELSDLKTERDTVRNWLRGASWALGALFAVVTVGGTLGVRSLTQAFSELAAILGGLQ